MQKLLILLSEHGRFPRPRCSSFLGGARFACKESCTLSGEVAKWLGNGLQNRHTPVRIWSSPQETPQDLQEVLGCFAVEVFMFERAHCEE